MAKKKLPHDPDLLTLNERTTVAVAQNNLFQAPIRYEALLKLSGPARQEAEDKLRIWFDQAHVVSRHSQLTPRQAAHLAQWAAEHAGS